VSTKQKKPGARRPAPPGPKASKSSAGGADRNGAAATAAPPGRRFGGATIALAVAAVVVVVAVIAVLVTRSSNSANAGSQTYPVTVGGAALPVMPDSTSASTPDPGVGLAAPKLTGQSLFDGSPMTITAGGGRRKLVVFVAHWCPHCQREVPVLVQWMNSGQKPADLDVVAVSTANNRSDVNSPASAWLQREKWPTPVMADSGDDTAANAYGLPAYPYLVLLDGNGKVTARTSGELTVDQLNSFVKGNAT
jgi:thiol-disulfide isomerase/thioredoxin